MNNFSCCSSCSGMTSAKVFPLGSYIPYEPGYGHTFGSFNPVGVAGPLMGVPTSRPYPGPKLPVGSTTAIYRRGEGNPAPFISLPTFNGYSETGNPNLFQPFGGYGSTGNPNNFNVFNAMPSPSNPMGDLNPVGESLPAQVGQPYRMGGEGIGGMPQMESMGSYYDDQPYNTWSGL